MEELVKSKKVSSMIDNFWNTDVFDNPDEEFSRSSFTGSFHLPENVAKDHISATYRKGLLCIDIKKAGLTEPEKTEVKVRK